MPMLRLTAAAVLICIAVAGSAYAECASAMPILWSNENLERGPAAWTGAALVVTAFERDTRAIWVGVYDETGIPLVQPRRIAESSLRGPMALLWTGEELGLFYATANGLRLQRLSPMGDPIAPPIAVQNREIAPGDEFDFVWSPALDAYFVGRTTTRGILGAWVTIVETSGTVRRDQRLIALPAPRASIRVAVTDSGIGGVFYRADPTGEIVYVRVDQESYTPRFPVASAGDHLVVTSRANRFLVLRSVPIGEGRTGVRWLEIDTSGNIVKADTLLLTGSGVDVAPAAVVARDSEIAVAYRDWLHGVNASPATYRLRRIRPDGTLISDLPFAAIDLGKQTFGSLHPFFWTGSAYVQVVGRGHAQTLNTHLVRYCPLRAEISAPRTVRRGEVVTLTASGGGGVPPLTYNWTFGDRRSGRGRSVEVSYPVVGTYRITLTTTDASALVESATFDITVIEPKRRAASH